MVQCQSALHPTLVYRVGLRAADQELGVVSVQDICLDAHDISTIFVVQIYSPQVTFVEPGYCDHPGFPFQKDGFRQNPFVAFIVGSRS